MDTIKVGVVGIGNMGSAHANAIANGEIKGMQLVAVCDIDEEKRSWAAQSFQDGVQIFEDYKAMINQAELDFVLIATPHYFHCEIAIYAFEHGKHVLTEKPAGVYTKQVEEMNEAAKKSGKVFGIMYNQRTNPLYAKLRQMIKDGELGELKRSVWIITNWYRTQAYYDSGTWRATWAGEGGGVLLNQCPHNLDLWQWIVGMPSKITGHCSYGKYHHVEIEDDVTAYVEYPNGATGVFITTTGEAPGTNRLEVAGTKGKAVVENGKLTFWRLSEDERKICFESKQGFPELDVEKIDVQVDGEETAHKGILQNITNHILKGEPLLAPGYEGINGLTISNAIHLSDWTGKQIELPIDKEQFYNLLKARAEQSHIKDGAQSEGKPIKGEYNTRWSIKW